MFLKSDFIGVAHALQGHTGQPTADQVRVWLAEYDLYASGFEESVSNTTRILLEGETLQPPSMGFEEAFRCPAP